ncbi:MAG TPA: hypothetical protein VF533_24545 [Solirubrobacteraceae bacterium]|jgi:hypothetical protein
MGYATGEARQDLLDEIAQAIDHLGKALADLGGAYELLDEASADRLEEELFRPVQLAYGRAKRTHASFAGRYRLPSRAFSQPSPGAPSHGVKGFLETAVEAVDDADHVLVDLQDSMMPVEVGDPELRAGLAEIREAVDHTRARAREFMRGFGR